MSNIDSLTSLTLSFEPLQPKDFATLRALADCIWKVHYPGIISMEQIEFMLERNFNDDKILLELSQGFIYELMILNGEAVGYTAYRFETESQRVFLSKMYLLVELHGKGLGQQALSHVLAYAKEQHASSVYLFVNKKNEKAILAYQRFGFKKNRELITQIGGGFVMDDFEMTFQF
ncbi:MAG: GNAT family N-acetyltransferase [Chloroherpetonaceae bacterium]|nr:GNAT family N-acetyltransferase [Chloroherpetonaceae bacterium]